uniref:hypothetical protein n=1 Tax=Lactiplantibacillus plantarum TaxID=1590 RepID=UPI001C9E364D
VSALATVVEIANKANAAVDDNTRFLIFIIINTLSYNLRVFDYLHIFSIGRAVDVSTNQQ